jgi:hypothetical protein
MFCSAFPLPEGVTENTRLCFVPFGAYPKEVGTASKMSILCLAHPSVLDLKLDLVADIGSRGERFRRNDSSFGFEASLRELRKPGGTPFQAQ